MCVGFIDRRLYACTVFHTIRVESWFFHLQLVFSTIFTGMNVTYIYQNDHQSSLNPIIIGSSHHMTVT